MEGIPKGKCTWCGIEVCIDICDYRLVSDPTKLAAGTCPMCETCAKRYDVEHAAFLDRMGSYAHAPTEGSEGQCLCM